MRFGTVFAVAFLSMALLNACAARSRMGNAIVQQTKDGQPCFGIESTAATRSGSPKLEAIAVSVNGDGNAPSRDIWSFMVEPKSTGLMLAPDQCVPYGNVPPGMRKLVEPSSLKPGIIYTVSVGARLADPTDPTLAYRAEFCLIPGSPVPRVHQVVWDPSAGKWQREVCTANATRP